MPKITTERIKKESLAFSYDVYADKEGFFTTTLPQEVVEKLRAANIDLNTNRLGNYGHFSNNTLDGLKQEVRNVVDEFFSRKLTCRKIVIRYVIQTTCAYCIDTDGTIVPNGNWTKREGYSWKNGTISTDATNRHPFGIQVYAQPYVREDYAYKSGMKKTEYILMCYADESIEKIIEKGYFLRWLADIPCQDVPEGTRNPMEMDYTEEVAAFFVNLISSICKLNEKIKDKLDPKSILQLISNKQHLLGS